MELRQLEYFVAVAEERNFTRAAAKLHVTQPGVSAQIRQLERELGQELLDRSGRAVRLTEAGTAVLPFALAALGAVNGARLAIDEISGLMRGHVAVGMVVQCASLDIPDLLAGFHRRHPGIEITLAEDSSDHLTDAVRDGTYDLAFIGLGPVTPPGRQPLAGLDLQVVADEPIVAAVAPDSDLAGLGSVTLAQIADRAVISLPAGTGLRACVDAAYESAGRQARVGFEASDQRMLARLAARGLGLAYLPASVARAHGDGLHVLVVSDPEMRGRLALTWRTEAPVSPAARALIAHARAALPEAGSGPVPASRPAGAGSGSR
ncbi:MAG: LysR family transcriptional regulator [Streptosporangiaceae bacterium]